MNRVAFGISLLVLIAGGAQAALLGRDLNGSAGSFEAYYDDVLNITWMADANLAATNTFGVSGIIGGGAMNWHKANEWIAAMNAGSYLGYDNWRLPTVGPLDGSSFDDIYSYNGSTDFGYNQSEQGTAYAGSTASEMAHLFFNTLDNKSYCDPVLSTVDSCAGPQLGWGLTNSGPFSNLAPSFYWSGTSVSSGSARVFDFQSGAQDIYDKTFSLMRVWAVRPGDVAVVPVPAAAWMLGSALGLMGMLRRRSGH